MHFCSCVTAILVAVRWA